MKLNLGCGFHPFKGWMNLDVVNCEGVEHCDLSHKNCLWAFYDGPKVDFIFSEHFLEHIKHDQAVTLMKDCHRVLKPGGVIRVSTPDLWKLVDAYTHERLDIWGGAWQPKTKAQMLNEGMRDWGHKYMYDLPELTGLLHDAGFRKVTPVKWLESEYPELRKLEIRSYMGELIVEGVK